MDPLHPDYVPSIFTVDKVPKTSQKQKLKRYARAQKRKVKPVSPQENSNSSSEELCSDFSVNTTDSKFCQMSENMKTIDDYKAEIALLKAEIAILKNNEVISEGGKVNQDKSVKTGKKKKVMRNVKPKASGDSLKIMRS